MAKFGEVSWDDDSGSNNGEKRQNNKDEWLRLEGGSNVVRLVTRPHQYIVHKGVKKESDTKGFGQKVYCSNPDGKGSCPLCDMGLKSGQRWLLGVIDNKTNAYKILDLSYQVFSQIKKLNRNDVWGDPTKYDIDIVVDKKGGPTGYYSVQPIPHKPLSPEAQKIVAAADLDDLKRKVTPPTTEQVQKRLDKILEGEPVAMPAVVTMTKPVAKSATAKKPATPQVTTDDEENVDDIFPSYDSNA